MPLFRAIILASPKNKRARNRPPFDIYLQLGQESPKTAPWLPELQAHLDNLGRALNRPVPQFLDPLALANAAQPDAGANTTMSSRSALPVLTEDDVTKMSGPKPRTASGQNLGHG